MNYHLCNEEEFQSRRLFAAVRIFASAPFRLAMIVLIGRSCQSLLSYQFINSTYPVYWIIIIRFIVLSPNILPQETISTVERCTLMRMRKLQYYKPIIYIT